MPEITDLTLRPDSSVDGSEEIPVQLAGVGYKVNASGIVKAIQDELDSYELATDATLAALTADKLNKTGGTLTGALTLSGAPSNPLHAAPKNFVEGLIAGLAPTTGASFDITTTGITQIDTIEDNTLATTEYVANKIEYETRKTTEIASTPKILTEADRGILLVTHTTIAPVVINLPQISALAISTDRTEFTIIDAGLNAENNNITINSFAGDTINGSSSLVITIDGGTATLVNNGSTGWFEKDKEQSASETAKGLIELANTTEVALLADTTRAVTAAGLNNSYLTSIFKTTNVGTTPFSALEAHTGILRVQLAGPITINLPFIAALTSAVKTRYTIVDERGTASTAPITINANGANTINGESSYVIDEDYGAVSLYTVGATTTWFTSSNSNEGPIKYASLSIATADVLTLNSVPKEIIPAPGAGKIILILSADAFLGFNSIAYATNTTLQLRYNFAAAVVASSASFLAVTNSPCKPILRTYNSGVGTFQAISNTSVLVDVATGDPTAGNSDIKVMVSYRIVDL